MTLIGTAFAQGSAAGQRNAAAAAEACLASCSKSSADCKRLCPNVLGAPCLTSCDSQYGMCTRGCQR